MIIVSQLGDSFPHDADVDEQLSRRVSYPFIPYAAVIKAFGAKSNDIELRCARLRAFLADMPGEEVVLLGRSSGARVVTRVACGNLANVRGVIALGYPFKHPNNPPEEDRVAHLAHLPVPTLIVQGERDHYGGRAEIGRYAFSPAVEVQLLPADHRIRLSPEMWDEVASRITAFLAGLSAQPALGSLPVTGS